MVAGVQGRTSPPYFLSDMLRPRMFDHVVEAVDLLTNQSPHLGKQLTYFVKDVARLKVGLGMRLENSLGEDMVHKAEKFPKLYDASWSRQVLRRADRKIKVRRPAQPKELPLSEDVNNISVWLKKTLAEAEENKEGRMLKRFIKLPAPQTDTTVPGTEPVSSSQPKTPGQRKQKNRSNTRTVEK